jgi:hypothetical protein
VLGQLVLLACIAAGMTASCILFVLYGPVPVKRKVTIVPRQSPKDVFDSSPRHVVMPSQIAATAVEPPIAFAPRGETPPPLPRGRSARGTTAPRHRPSDDNLQTDRVPRIEPDTGAFMVDGR